MQELYWISGIVIEPLFLRCFKVNFSNCPTINYRRFRGTVFRTLQKPNYTNRNNDNHFLLFFFFVQLSSAGVIRLPRFEMTMAKADANTKPVLAAEDVHIVTV